MPIISRAAQPPFLDHRCAGRRIEIPHFDDPALSAVIADAMAESMSKTVAANSRVEEDDYIPMSKEEIEELVNEEPGWHLATEEDEK